MQCPVCKCKKATTKLWSIRPDKVFHCDQCNAPLKVRARVFNRFNQKNFNLNYLLGIPMGLACVLLGLNHGLWVEAGVFLALFLLYSIAFTRFAMRWVLKYDPA